MIIVIVVKLLVGFVVEKLIGFVVEFGLVVEVDVLEELEYRLKMN